MGPGPRPTVGEGLQPRKDLFEHACDVGTNIPVCKTKHVKAFGAERHIPLIVLWDFVRVAIDLNHEAFARTEEVDNEIADYMLAPKLVAAELRTVEMFPEDFFKGRGGVSEFAGSF